MKNRLKFSFILLLVMFIFMPKISASTRIDNIKKEVKN